MSYIASMLKFKFKWLQITATLLILTSCTLVERSQLRRLPTAHPSDPVIIIPGIMGSALVDTATGAVIWGKLLDLKAVNPHEALLFPAVDGVELPVDSSHTDGLVATNVLSRYQMFNRVGTITVYEDLIQTFSNCGLNTGDIQHCAAGDNLYLFAYDWRQDLVQTAALLAQRINAIRAVSGPDVRITLIAHSMGGLIAQYYLMYGGEDVLDDTLVQPDYSGAANIGKVFFLGTPFGGSPMAFKSLHEGEWVGPGVTISKWATFTMPSLYEMLPFNDPTIFVNQTSEPLALDLTRVQTWLNNGFSVFEQNDWLSFQQTCQIYFPESGPQLAHSLSQQYQSFFQTALRRGLAFQDALSRVDWDRITSDIYLINGNCRETLKQIRLSTGLHASDPRIVRSRFWNEHYWISASGDGTVLSSAVAGITPSATATLSGCFQHRSMPNEPEVIRFILKQL